MYSIAHGFNIGAVIKSTINLVLNITIPLIIYTNLKSLYNCLVRLNTILKKRLIVNFICLRQLYEHKEIAKIK